MSVTACGGHNSAPSVLKCCRYGKHSSHSVQLHCSAVYSLRQSSQQALSMCFSGKRVVQLIVIVFLLCIRGEYYVPVITSQVWKVRIKVQNAQRVLFDVA